MSNLKPLDSIFVLDFTDAQSGPSCTQGLAWFVTNIGSLYFAMLSSNKCSVELNTKTPEGKQVIERLIKQIDILVEDFLGLFLK